MKLIQWKESYSVKIKELDAQHKKFIKLINELYLSMEKGSSDEEIKKIIINLLDYANIHFETEEKYFKKFNFKGSKSHIKEHDTFRRKIDIFKLRIDKGELMLDFELAHYLSSWLNEHLLNIDQKYVDCFVENGLR